MKIRIIKTAMIRPPELRESSLPCRAHVPLPLGRERHLVTTLPLNRHRIKVSVLHVINLLALFGEAQLCFTATAREPFRFLAVVPDAPNVALRYEQDRSFR